MAINKKKITWISATVIAITLVSIQWVKVTPNNSGNKQYHISKAYPTSYRVSQLLDHACNDCHSNTTTYPWYTHYQPFGMWIENHVEEGKEHLNFDEFTQYRPWKQYHKMEELVEVIEEDEMPMFSYTLMHEDAKLAPEDKQSLILWAKGVMDSMSHLYPKDSLIRPKKKD